VKILIISGFLGAGKTTFIKAMTHATGRSFVIYENEYGASSVDTKILENENLSVWESTEKCVCCSGKGDFAQTIISISADLNPDYLIVEPTGIAKLCSILENLRQITYDRIQVLSPVTIVDSVNWKQQRKTASDVWEDQITGCTTAVLSKISKSEDISELKREISRINAEATIIEESFDSLSCGFFMSLLGNTNKTETENKVDSKTNNLVQLSMNNVKLPTVAHLAYILDLCVMGAFGKVSRAKGFMPCGTLGEWIKFDLVEREWAITGMEVPSDTQSVAIFIGEELEKKTLHDLFLETYVSGTKKLHLDLLKHQTDKVLF